MKKRDIQILLGLLGVLIAFASWRFVFTKNQDKAKEIAKENKTLEEQLDRLEELDAKKDEYIADTEKMKTECDEIARKFPAGLYLEDIIMYLYNMELKGTNDTKVPEIAFESPVEVAYTGSTETDDGYTLEDDGSKLWEATTTVGIKTTGNGLKNMLDYIYAMPGRKSIQTLELQVQEEGFLEGSMEIDFYAMTGTDVPYVEVDIPTMPLGTTNLWSVATGSARTEMTEEDAEGENAEGEEADAESEDEE